MVSVPAILVFPPFQLDVTTGTLWKGQQRCQLRSQVAAVLHYLLARPNQVISKEELLASLWPGQRVSPGVLKTYIWELRRALHDQQQKPRFIETLPRRGYRWIAPLSATPPGVSRQLSVISKQKPSAPTQLATENRQLTTPFVGREIELSFLSEQLEKALSGGRQVVFIAGEPGIGKTTLVEAFLHQAAARSDLWLARGQCIEHYGVGEAYFPLLSALGQLGQEPGKKQLVKSLHQYAPTWLAQLPALLSVVEREQVQREAQGASRERMLRELAEAVEALTAKRGLILVLEDLHWSDVSTLDWLAVVARRYVLARLCIIGTYRPGEAPSSGHPLRAVIRELAMHRQCTELSLGLLSKDAVAEYLTQRFASVPSPLAGEARPERSRRGQNGGSSQQGGWTPLTLALSHKGRGNLKLTSKIWRTPFIVAPKGILFSWSRW